MLRKTTNPMTSLLLLREIKRLRSFLFDSDPDDLRSRLLGGTIGIFVLRAFSIVLSVGIGILLARLLGGQAYGAYAYSMAWLGILGVVSVLGLDRIIIREFACYKNCSDWSSIHGLLRWANRFVLWTSLGLAALATTLVLLLSEQMDPLVLPTLCLALLLLPILSLTRIRAAALQGLHRVVLGNLSEKLIQPLLFLLLLGGIFFVLREKQLPPISAMASYAASLAIASFLGMLLLKRSFPQGAIQSKPIHQTRKWIHHAFPILIIDFLCAVNSFSVPILVGQLKDHSAVGIYSVAFSGASLVILGLAIVNTASGSTIAALHSQGDMIRLQKLMTNGTLMALCLALPAALLLIVFGNQFLMLYGNEFSGAHLPLAILCVAQLVNVAMGSVGLLLIMSGHERDVIEVMIPTTVLGLALEFILISKWGVIGAAISAAIVIITWNVLLGIRVYQRMGIRPLVLQVPRILVSFQTSRTKEGRE